MRIRFLDVIFIDKIKTLLGGGRVDPVSMAAFKAFKAASDVYDTALSGIETDTIRANHR